MEQKKFVLMRMLGLATILTITIAALCYIYQISLSSASPSNTLPDYCLSFDGVDDYVEVPHSSSLNVEYITLSAMVFPTEYKVDQRIIAKEYGAAEPFGIYQLLLSGQDEKYLEFRIAVGGTRYILSGMTVIPLNNWTHVAATFDGQYMKIYVNRKIDGTLAVSGKIMQYINPVYIGDSQFYERNWKGKIDNVAIWNRALSQSEVQSLYATTPTDGLVLMFDMNEGTGITLHDSSPMATNNGIIHGATWTLKDSPSIETSQTFGVVAQYYRSDEMATYYPDLWALVDYTGAKYVSGAVRRWAADQAAEHGVKLIMGYTEPYADPNNPKDFASKETIKAHFDIYNIAQYRNHPGVYGHIVHGEPCMNYSFDPRYPDSRLLALIDNFKYACDYVRSLDPTHPVWVALNPAGAYFNPIKPLSTEDIEKLKAWINLFIDFCDVLDYHLYLHGDAGNEYWRNPDVMRQNLVKVLDEVLIPCSKGKPIIIGETGCPTGDYKDWKGQIAHFTEEQQAEYFRIFGEETKKRGIFVYIFKLIDPLGETNTYGLFTSTRGETMNVAKKAASHVKDYLSLFKAEAYLKTDLNKDGKVDMEDIFIIARAFDSHGPDIPNTGDPPSENWNAAADVNKDGYVNIKDIFEIAKDYGKIASS
jgi:hypothetical protein